MCDLYDLYDLHDYVSWVGSVKWKGQGGAERGNKTHH